MKNLIDNLGITHRRFAELYNIPYTTVAQWYKGERNAPKWLKSLIEQIIELKTNGKQLSITNEKLYIIEYQTIYANERQFYCSNSEYKRNQNLKCFFTDEKLYVYIKTYEIDKD